MVGLGVPWAWVALGAISAAHHGWPENVANYGAEYRTARVREVDVGIVQTLSNQNSRVTIGFKLVKYLLFAYPETYFLFTSNFRNILFVYIVTRRSTKTTSMAKGDDDDD